jgi:hypothetical protein
LQYFCETDVLRTQNKTLRLLAKRYENSSVFETVMPNKLVSWKRKSQPLFNMEIAFEKLEENKTQISFRMIFETVEECDKIRKFAEPKNEENFDRLERVIGSIENASR